MLLARVAIPVPLGRTFTYEVPANLQGACRPGVRAICDFGRRRLLGVVLQVEDGEPSIELERIKPLVGIVDEQPVLPAELLSFLVELGRYYLAPMGEVMRLALPAIERDPKGGSKLNASGAKLVGRPIQVAHAISDLAPTRRLGDQARQILAELARSGPTAITALTKRWSNARGSIKRLVDEGLVRVDRAIDSVDPYFDKVVERDVPPSLTAAQNDAVAAITGALERGERGTYLLHGVTASGKTEVYLHAVERCLELGKGALVLVPEIALTPQLVARFRARLGDEIAVLHSGLTERLRLEASRKLRSGQVKIAIGARSALFAPILSLGLVCVDEEHDSSFKQEEGVRYHARDMALLRAYRAGGCCVLGSATPSLGTEHLVCEGQVTKLSLPSRAHAASLMPEIEIVDLRRMGPGPSGDRLVTVPVTRELNRVLSAGEQAILFLNRRGFAPSLICDDCGQIASCPDCSVSLTVHRATSPRLICHYCGYTVVYQQRCTKCNGIRVVEEGSGTERVQEVLAGLLPGARIARLDRDVAAGAKSEKVLSRMRAGEVDILVGTQMVTKGHDLPQVTFVAVLDADASLSLPDFRAAERTFQLLVQVAGRAGRADRPGRVLIQTRQPEAPAISFASRHDVSGFLAQELLERRELSYPPFSRLAMVRGDAMDEAAAFSGMQRLAAVARAAAPALVQVLGPSPAPIARVRNRFRYRFLIKSPTRAALRETALAVLRHGTDRRLRVLVDVDPLNML